MRGRHGQRYCRYPHVPMWMILCRYLAFLRTRLFSLVLYVMSNEGLIYQPAHSRSFAVTEGKVERYFPECRIYIRKSGFLRLEILQRRFSTKIFHRHSSGHGSISRDVTTSQEILESLIFQGMFNFDFVT